MRRIIFYLLIFLFIHEFSFAQSNCNLSLKITVVDEQTKTPMPGSVVQIGNSKLVQETDENGIVQFNNLCMDDYDISISFLSYHTISKNIKLSKNSAFRFELSPSVKNITNVNIISERSSIQSTMSKIELNDYENFVKS